MNATEALAKLRAADMPVLETGDVAGILRMKTSAATMTLGRLARSGLVSCLRPGQWLVSGTAVNRYSLAEYVTAPFPSYVSLHTALCSRACPSSTFRRRFDGRYRAAGRSSCRHSDARWSNPTRACTTSYN